jgi:transglutaminase-like putative cysteine protease
MEPTMRHATGILALLALAACSGGTTADKECCAGGAAAKPAAACCEAGSKPQAIAKEFLKPGDSRTFAVEYTAKISEIPAGTKKLRIWVPVPASSSVQEIRNLSFSKEPKIACEPKYGNTIASWDLENPDATAEVTMKFECTRLEVLTNLDALKAEGQDVAGAFDVFRKPDALVLVDDETKKISAGLVAGKAGTVAKARAIYDYVVGKMVYDKEHKGWGLGSTRHACDVGKGNCTDFHALFNSLCRSEGIASGFEIGLYLPYEKGKIEPPGGYHCWALFRVPGKTWVPVDCSEAMRFADRREYFFGGHTSNRVTLSTGRDILLEPRQAGAPLNYFLNPYAEGDGKPVKATKTWNYKDLN